MLKAIYLTGFMGAGKTTVGEKLAAEMNLPVLDTDQEIIKKLNKSIKDMFEQQGEQYFRLEETKMLKELPTENIIITTGGGIVIKEENRAWMKEHGHIVMLHADLNTIFDRVQSDQTRPLASKKSKDELYQLYKSRESFYNDCSLLIETDHKNIDEIVKEIKERLKESEIGNR